MEQLNESKELITVLPEDISHYDYDAIIEMAERSERLVSALNRIMAAAIRITTPLDWVFIGGKPYLQESGATKVARLFGIGWKIIDVTREMDEGYPSYTYRMLFRMGQAEIECDGARTGKDEFFTGKKEYKNGDINPNFKGPDQISVNDVKKAAYTNCLNNGVKRLLPGLRNIDQASLEQNGIDIRKVDGYTFRDGTRGGAGRNAKTGGLVCSVCGAAITQKVASFSEGKFGKRLCMACQKQAPASAPDDEYAPPDDIPPLPEEPR